MWKKVFPVVDYSVRKLCLTPYRLHKKGCPNFGNKNKKQCPPHGPKIENVIDLSDDVYCIFTKFNLAQHVKKMSDKHPNWSRYQLRCVLYWQGKARKKLRKQIKLFLEKNKGLEIVSCPEGCGVNVTATMKQIGIKLEWPPKKWTYQIVLAGKKVTAK